MSAARAARQAFRAHVRALFLAEADMNIGVGKVFNAYKDRTDEEIARALAQAIVAGPENARTLDHAQAIVLGYIRYRMRHIIQGAVARGEMELVEAADGEQHAVMVAKGSA